MYDNRHLKKNSRNCYRWIFMLSPIGWISKVNLLLLLCGLLTATAMGCSLGRSIGELDVWGGRHNVTFNYGSHSKMPDGTLRVYVLSVQSHKTPWYMPYRVVNGEPKIHILVFDLPSATCSATQRIEKVGYDIVEKAYYVYRFGGSVTFFTFLKGRIDYLSETTEYAEYRINLMFTLTSQLGPYKTLKGLEDFVGRLRVPKGSEDLQSIKDYVAWFQDELKAEVTHGTLTDEQAAHLQSLIPDLPQEDEPSQ